MMWSMTDSPAQLYKWTRNLLRPFARILLRRGMSYGEFAEAAKSAFVDAAANDQVLPGRKQTSSRISTITGLSRKEVFRLQNQTETDTVDALHKLNRAVRVISGWTTDAKYLDADNKPLHLPFEKATPSFSELVKEYSGDITARTIADELSRIGAISQDAEGKLELIRQAYIVQSDTLAQLKLLSETIAELTATIEHNMNVSDSAQKRFQRKVYYDNIPAESVDALKKAVEARAQACLLDINQVLVTQDRDHNPDMAGSGRKKIGVGVYYFEEDVT